MSRRIIIVIISIVVLVASVLIGYSISSSKKEVKKKTAVEKVKYVNTINATYSTYSSEISALGRVNSFDKVDLFSEVQGTLIDLSKKFKVGTSYAKGDLIIAVDSETTELELKSAKSRFHSLLTSLMPDIKNDYKKFFDLWLKYLDEFGIEKDIKELPEYDDKLKFFLSSKNVFTTFYEIKNLEVMLDKYKIYAPFSGVITESMIDKGGLVRPGQKLGQIASTNSFELELSVDVNDLNMIKLGDVVEIFSENGDSLTSGRISRIAGNIDINTQTIKVFVQFNSAKVKDGMYLRGIVGGNEITDVVEVNRSAIVNNKFIYYIDNQTLNKKEIDIVRLNAKFAYIKGIEANTEIINEPIANVQLGMKIRSAKEL